MINNKKYIIMIGNIYTDNQGCYYLMAEDLRKGEYQRLCQGCETLQKIYIELKLAGFIETHRQWVLKGEIK